MFETSPRLSHWESWREAPERASPARQGRFTAIGRRFVRAMLSLCLRFSVSILALSVTFGDTSPKGRGFGVPQRSAFPLYLYQFPQLQRVDPLIRHPPGREALVDGLGVQLQLGAVGADEIGACLAAVGLVVQQLEVCLLYTSRCV